MVEVARRCGRRTSSLPRRAGKASTSWKRRARAAGSAITRSSRRCSARSRSARRRRTCACSSRPMRAMAGSRFVATRRPPWAWPDGLTASGTLWCHCPHDKGTTGRLAAWVPTTARPGPASTSTGRQRVRELMAEQGIDVLLLSVGHDLPYLTGYLAMPLERLTMLVLPRDGDATLVVPRLEAPRVVEQPGVFALRPWSETEDPVAIVADLAGAPGRRRRRRPDLGPVPGRPAPAAAGDRVPAGGRRRRSAADAQGRDRDRRARGGRRRRRPRRRAAARAATSRCVGRTEAQVSADISQRLIAEGHDKVNFAIVAAGENAASPHHHAGPRVIERGEIVLCDFGGTMDGYCSDITRCVHLGQPPAEVRDAYAVLHAGAAGRRRRGPVGVRLRGRRPRGTPHHRRGRLRRVLRAPHRARHRHGGARGPVHGRGQRRAAGSPGTPTASSPASTSPGGGGCVWRTSWSPPSDGPEPLNRADHALVVLDA